MGYLAMTMEADFAFCRYCDGVLTVSMAPPVAIGGWSLQVEFSHRMGSAEPLFTRYAASGYVGSGITVVSSGAGIFTVQVDAPDTSGMQLKNYACLAKRTDSGSRTDIFKGYMLLGL
jgi:hypothetical protein